MTAPPPIPPALAGCVFVPVAAGSKGPPPRGWPALRLGRDDIARHLAAGGNVALRLGAASSGVVDVDLDAPEALALADLYLPDIGAMFGRASRPGSHRLYRAPGAVFAAFADPASGEMLVELRADGRDGGAHLTLIPPSRADGEARVWAGADVLPAAVEAAALHRRVAWLAIGCLVARHLSPYAARRPGPDLPGLLWEADPALGRAAYHWLGAPAPDERRSARPRRMLSPADLRLDEVVAAIPNTFGWDEWNRLGMAIYAASGGSEAGYAAFDDLSARSPKYDPAAVRERWRNFRRSPPSRIGIGTLVRLAREAGWHGRAA